MGGNERLEEGRQMRKRFETWAQISAPVFSNKCFLLQAEYAASVQNYTQAQQLYIASIEAAQSHGRLHELAIAYECLGKFYQNRHDQGGEADSNDCFRKAHVCFTQYGAKAVARKIFTKYDLNSPVSSPELQSPSPELPGTCKHSRE